MTVIGSEALGVTEKRWMELEEIISQEMRKTKTPAKFMLALDKRSDITSLEKLLMTYALAFKQYQEIHKIQISVHPMQLRVGLN